MKTKDLLPFVGNLTQLGGTRHYELTDGWARNLRGIDINSGSGLKYTILPDRGMDISLASFKDANLVYLTCNGETHPSFYEPENIGWLRTFAGGLLTTCGLTHIGGPATEDGENYGLHGRYSTTPAKQVADLSGWINDDYHIKIKGTIEEGFLFGKKLRLEREIRTILGQNKLIINDTVTNFGNQPSPYTILYHMNFGYPMLSEDTELIIYPENTIPRDNDALSGIDEFHHFSEPQIGYKEQVFFHTMKGNKQGETEVHLINKKLKINLTIRFNIKSLPYLTQWKMMGIGEYVLGLEPCNVPCKNRTALKEEKLLPTLLPGEMTTNRIELEITEFL
jgi:galactose mutarotase-like enzyme